MTMEWHCNVPNPSKCTSMMYKTDHFNVFPMTNGGEMAQPLSTLGRTYIARFVRPFIPLSSSF